MFEVVVSFLIVVIFAWMVFSAPAAFEKKSEDKIPEDSVLRRHYLQLRGISK